ncbi:MAG: CBS domain-containing protein [Aigarchaeota archaeon]|nr:CBS domain-containing protein [Aigarchaeota archaeon]MCX8193369.1 CBS domain-containing protein [Nitrososphaeria archaeon]MDW7985899.1 CBS domain-containing protein [Nitrososphaerota archaeon]
MTTLTDELRVRDVMSSPVIEASENDTAQQIAQKMEKYNVGSVVITRSGVPVGIVTKTDLVLKVVSRNLKPSEVKTIEIMSSPIHTVEPDTLIEDALRKMTALKVSRLIVTYKNKLVGIVSVKDILQVTPEILEIVKENMRIRGVTLPTSKEGYIEGYCDECGEWSDMLLNVDGRYICEECRLELARRRAEE